MANNPVKITFTKSLLVGSVSGLVTTILLQPFDRIKTLSQQVENRNASVSSIFKATVRNGTLELWRGFTPTVLRIVPGVALYFGMVQSSTTYLPWKKGEAFNFLVGFGSRTFVTTLLQPTTVLKTRFESSVWKNTSITIATREIVRTQGIRGLWRGLVPTILRDAPFSGLYLMTYKYQLSFTDDSSVTPVIRLLCGFSSGIFACLVTQPFDMIKTMVQLYPTKYTTFRETSLMLIKSGTRVIFRGFLLRASRRTLASAFSWCFFDELILFDRRRQSQKLE